MPNYAATKSGYGKTSIVSIGKRIGKIKRSIKIVETSTTMIKGYERKLKCFFLTYIC